MLVPAKLAQVNAPARRGVAGKRVVVATLAIVLGDGDTPPSEFRLFVPGWNDTENGRFLFDELAAESVMAAHKKWGVDVMIDLEHQALEVKPGSADPTARDARGWCRLELRPDGSLWAVNVRWTPDGAERLAQRRQRYVSPAFGVDPETSRVTSILNIAITSIPATHDTPALVAASLLGVTNMDQKLKERALEALMADDADACKEILKSMVAGDGSAPPAEEPPPPAELAAGEETAAAETPPPGDEDKDAVVAATSRLTRITGKDTIGAAVEEVEAWRTSHLKLEAETARLSKERAALELNKRKENGATLVRLGAETPHTSGLEKGKLCKRLQDEPLDEQNARVAALLAARGGKLPEAPTPPAGGSETPDLSPSELAMCATKKIDPVKYAATRKAIADRSNVKKG